LAENGYDVSIYERSNHVGGMCASWKWNDFILDVGPHIFHTPDMKLAKFWQNEFGHILSQGNFYCQNVKGKNFDEFYENEPCRVISGSVLSGFQAEGDLSFLGRYSRQVTLIKEDEEKLFFGWINPQPNKFSVMPVLASACSFFKLFNLTTNLNGGRRAMVPTGIFETLMPQDFLPTQLLRSLIVMDTDVAQSLGALELDEEDISLCTFACPAKYEYGSALRDSLEKIEKEG
jgi:Na+-transporting NADH:ubiquinone oxidoreductase subunit A